MYRRYRERRHYRRHRSDTYERRINRFSAALRRPATQIAILLIVALIIYIILQSAR